MNGSKRDAISPTTPAAAAATNLAGMARRAALILIYLALNIGLNMLNKVVMTTSGFTFPLTLCTAHMLFSFVLLAPVVMLMPRYKTTDHYSAIRTQRKGLLIIGVCFALNIGLNNSSLAHISLSLNQIIRSSIPAVAAIASFYLEGRRVSRLEFGALFVLISGVAMTVADGSTSTRHAPDAMHAWGLIACVLSTVANGLMMSASAMVLKERIDAIRLTFYQAPIVVACLLPFIWLYERIALARYVGAPAAAAEQLVSGPGIGLLVALTCFLAASYNIVHVAVIENTSAVTTTVIGEAKIVLIVLLSALILGERDILSPLTTFGATVAMFGFIMYGHARLKARAH